MIADRSVTAARHVLNQSADMAASIACFMIRRGRDAYPCRSAHWRRGAATALLGTVLSVAGAVAGDRSLPACPPRAHNDAGRLNIALEPEGYGIVAPCRANLEFYIAHNTPLRSIEAAIRVSGATAAELTAKAMTVDLERTDYGMFAARIGIGEEGFPACRRLSVQLELGDCRGEEDTPIPCPPVRLKAPVLLADFSATGADLVVCRDN